MAVKVARHWSFLVNDIMTMSRAAATAAVMVVLLDTVAALFPPLTAALSPLTASAMTHCACHKVRGEGRKTRPRNRQGRGAVGCTRIHHITNKAQPLRRETTVKTSGTCQREKRADGRAGRGGSMMYLCACACVPVPERARALNEYCRSCPQAYKNMKIR